MNWLINNFPSAWELTVEHAYLSFAPTVIGLIVALLLGLALGNRPRPRTIATVLASAMFTVPSLALFVIIPSLLGTGILNPLNVVIALSLYSASLLIRTVFDSLDAVPADALAAAEAMGYSTVRRRLLIDLPLAIPTLAAGLRVAAVTNVSLVSVGAVIGVGGLGQLFTAGYQRDYPDEILAGIIMVLALALVFDRIIAIAAFLLTPWVRAARSAVPRTAGFGGRR
ncbi:ABC transporter permease [Paeniglutamicibacter cryotolerans]|uniref:Osmoprotectant transport system permease protein n=1 Tax=Paeniglutamicibacter cryotolerans TaxID=670079 RepID=A0A839QRF2_9MICC|nr:ABC transporter permease subunit [Paeniglutamicibacter cryotolerans]MBB2997364.1 osmoprotectant transport system permease protein [Paeniglutamicibacter cryotolerans]